jgi:hypothetical protein
MSELQKEAQQNRAAESAPEMITAASTSDTN